MEVMEVTLATFNDISYVIIHHPIYSAIGSIFLFACMLKFYCKLTVGICDIEQDMTGKTVLITGASNGIGKATALDLARRNARVLLACRNIGKANKVAQEIISQTGNQEVIVKCLDLCSFASVRECAKSVLETETQLHVLINNAGITGPKQRKLTNDGCEMVMQSNHFGHFLLTSLLLDLLKRSAPSRIINVSSGAHMYARLNLEDLTNEENRHFHVYANTKLANILFTRELSERLQDAGVTVNSLHPGVVKTSIINTSELSLMSILTKMLFLLTGKTPEEGAQTTIRLAIDPQVENTTGRYFSDCKEAPVSKAAKDRAVAKRLFLMSERIVDSNFPRT